MLKASIGLHRGVALLLLDRSHVVTELLTEEKSVTSHWGSL